MPDTLTWEEAIAAESPQEATWEDVTRDTTFPGIKLTPYQEAELAAFQRGAGKPETGMEAGTELTAALGQLPEKIQRGIAWPGRFAYASAADLLASGLDQPEYGGNIPALLEGRALPAEEFIGQTARYAPKLAVTADIAASLSEMAPLAGMAALPAWANRLIAAGFSIDMIRNAPELARELGEQLGLPPEQQDPGKIAQLRSGLIQTTVFAPLAGAGSLTAITRAKQRKGATDASRLREDERQVQAARIIQQGREGQGRPDLEQPAPGQPSGAAPGGQPQTAQEGQARVLLNNNQPAIKLMPYEEGAAPEYEPALKITDPATGIERWETHDEIIKRARLGTEDIDRRVFLDEQGNEKAREDTAAELNQVGIATKVPGEAHSTDVNKLTAQTRTGVIRIEANQPLPTEILQQHLTPEEIAHLEEVHNEITDPIDIVTDPGDPNAPFARARKGQFMGINRQLGAIEIYAPEFKAWLAQDVPAARRREAIRARLAEESIHLRTPPTDALRYWDALTALEKYFEQRIYMGPEWRKRMAAGDITPQDLGFEAVRRRIQRLSRMSSSEAAEAAGRERWTVGSLEIMGDLVRGIRERLGPEGTKASQVQRDIIDRVLGNVDVAIAVASAAPAARRRTKAAEGKGTAELYLPPVDRGAEVERTGFKAPTGLGVQQIADQHFADLTQPLSLDEFRGRLGAEYGSLPKAQIYTAWEDAMIKRLMAAKGIDIERLMDRLDLRGEVARALRPKFAEPMLGRGTIPDALELPSAQMSLPEITKFFEQRQWKTKAAYRQKFSPEQRIRYAAIGEIINRLAEEAGAKPEKPWNRTEIGPEDISHIGQLYEGSGTRTVPPQFPGQAARKEPLTAPDFDMVPEWTTLRKEDLGDPAALGDFAVRGARVDLKTKATISNNILVLKGKDGRVFVVSTFRDGRAGPKVTNPAGASLTARHIDEKLLRDYTPMVVARLRNPVENLRQVFDSQEAFDAHFGEVGIEGTEGMRTSLFAGPQAGAARAQAGITGAGGPLAAEAALPTPFRKRPPLLQASPSISGARELTLPRFARRGVPAGAIPPTVERSVQPGLEPPSIPTPPGRPYELTPMSRPQPYETLPRPTVGRPVVEYGKPAPRQPGTEYRAGLAPEVSRRAPAALRRELTEKEKTSKRLYRRAYAQKEREKKYEERKQALETVTTLGGIAEYTKRGRHGLLTERPRVGAAELEAARQREDWQLWEYGLPFDGEFDGIIRRQLLKWGLRDAAKDDILLETAKSYIIHDRLGYWATEYSRTGQVPTVTPKDVWHSLNNFFDRPEGERALNLQRIRPAGAEEEFMPQRGEVSEEFAARFKPSVDPFELTARADTAKVIAEFEDGLPSEHQRLLRIYLETDGWTPERVKAIADFQQENGIGPSRFKRIRKELIESVNNDVPVTELLDSFRQKRRDLHDANVPREEPAISEPAALRRVADEAEMIKRDVIAMVKGMPTKQRITATLDNVDNMKNNLSLQRENEVRFASVRRPGTVLGRQLTDPNWRRGNAQVLAAANVLVESVYDPQRAMWRNVALRQGQQVGDFDPRAIPLFRHQIERGRIRAMRHLNDPSASVRRMGRAEMRSYAQLKAELDYAEQHWNDPALQETARRLRRSYNEQAAELRRKKINVHEHPGFDPHRYDAAIWNGHSYLFNMASGAKKVLGERTLAQRTFDSYYHAFGADAFLPVTRDSATLLGHYMRKTNGMMFREAWREGLKALRTENGEELAGDPITREGKRLPHKFGYEIVNDGYAGLSVHPDWAPLIDLLVSPSYVEKSTPLRTLLHLEQSIKHSILIGDFFHLGRMLYYARAIMKGAAGYQSGWSVLDIAPRNIPEALAKGIIRQKDVDWANHRIALPRGRSISRREIVEKFYSEMGSNLGRVQDALYKELVVRLSPTSGPVRRGFVRVMDPSVGRYNRFLFDRLTRGFMAEAVAREFERQMNANPTVSPKALMRDIAKDVNNFFGNIGRQGWAKSKTMQDVNRLLWLAPQWVEGLIKKEIIGPGRFLGITQALGLRQGPTRLGTTGYAMARAMLFMFGLTQAINLITRRQPTWMNEEDGHKFDAWIPSWGGDKEGFFMSPFAIFNEVTHDLYRLINTKPTVGDAIAQIMGNKESPMTRAALVFITGYTPLGQKTTSTGSRLAETGKAMLPIPISFGKLGQKLLSKTFPSVVSPPPKSAVQRQFVATFGVKIEPGQSAVQRMDDIAKDFMKRNKLTKETGWQQIQTDQPGYTKLRTALRNNDEPAAQRNFKALREEHTEKEIVQDMERWANRGFTGSQTNEKLLLQVLTPEELKLYDQAVEEKLKLKNAFEDWFWKQPPAPPSAAPRPLR